MTKKLLSFVLAFVMLAGCAVFTAGAATRTSAPTYGIDLVYDVDSGIATATIRITGDSYRLGRFGFGYDATALKLITSDDSEFDAENDYIADVVEGVTVEDSYTVVTTEETNLTADLINTAEGKILFAWYVEARVVDGKDEGYINAKTAKELATVRFVLSDEFMAKENPTDALKEVEELIYPLSKDDIPEDVAGWNDVYVSADLDNDKKVTSSSNVKTSVDVTADISDIKLTLSTSGISLTANWNAEKYETEVANIASYKVVVKEKSSGTVVCERDIEAIDENKNSRGAYVTKFTEEDGIANNTTYVVTVTPVTESGKYGASVEKSVLVKKTTTTTTPTVSDKSEGDGYSPYVTVTYVAGEGTIPEGQKFKYNVKRNGYVDGSPEVVAPEGKVFAGWSVDGVTLVSVEVYKVTKDTTFKAIYVEKEEDTHRPFILGYPGGAVRADDFLTRAEAATIIARASGKYDSSKTYTCDFSDVPADHWAANYIAFVYENNIITGYEDKTFHPSSNITRAEFATIMQRFLGIESNEDATFVDVDKSHWAVAYIGACKNAGLINGYENGEFRPSNSITRAEAVKILNRATDRVPTSTAIDAYIAEKGVPFEDLSDSAWYFYEIMEAAFPHLISYYH